MAHGIGMKKNDHHAIPGHFVHIPAVFLDEIKKDRKIGFDDTVDPLYGVLLQQDRRPFYVQEKEGGSLENLRYPAKLPSLIIASGYR